MVVTPWFVFARLVLVCARNSLWHTPAQNGGAGQEALLSGEEPVVAPPVWCHRYRPAPSASPGDPTARLLESRMGFWPPDPRQTRTVMPPHSADPARPENGRGCCDGA